MIKRESDKGIIVGAFQLLQLQEDIRNQFKMDGSGPENDLESHLRLNKDTLMNSLWKLNVVDIEVTLLHVCQMVRTLSWIFFSFIKINNLNGIKHLANSKYVKLRYLLDM